MLETEKSELEAEEKKLAVKLEVLENAVKKQEEEKQKLNEKIHELSRQESVLFFSDMKGQCEKAERACSVLEKQKHQTLQRLEQCKKSFLEQRCRIKTSRRKNEGLPPS